MPLNQLRDFIPYNNCIIGVYKGGKYNPVEEFSIEDDSKIEEYASAYVSDVWIWDENTMCASAYI